MDPRHFPLGLNLVGDDVKNELKSSPSAAMTGLEN